jgi:phage shock protein A
LDNDSDHELVVQVARLRTRLNIVSRERDDLEDQCNQYQQAYQQADAERSQLREELQQWEQAATAASSLTRLLHPYSS